jgi:glycosyltransferase involved in cell wall biosynthesis
VTLAGGLRVLHVAQPTEGGVARCVLEFAAAQLRAGLDVTVACPPIGWLPAQLSTAGVPTRAWPAVRSPGPTVPAETGRLRRVVADAAPDLVHLHAAKAGLAGRLAVRGRLPTVFQPHAWSFEAVTGPLRAATIAWERLATRWSDVLVCVSEAERAAGAAAGVRMPRTAVVPNGVDLTRLTTAGPEERKVARAVLGLTPDVPLCVCIGRLARQKGQDVLLAAWPSVLQEVPDAELLLVGDGPDRAELQRTAPPRAQFAGGQADVLDWLAAADVVVAPSRWEGMALVPLEAMARARSVVVSDVAGMAEAVAPGAGAIVPVGQTQPLAAAVASRLRDRAAADAEGRIGRKVVETQHDLARTVAGLDRAYADALAAGERRSSRPQARGAADDN